MRWPCHEPFVEAPMKRVEERLEEARAYAALEALLRASRPPRRPWRVWLGSALLAAGHRLLRSVPKPTRPHRLTGSRAWNRDEGGSATAASTPTSITA